MGGLEGGNKVQFARQLSLDLSDISNASDVMSKLRMLDLDLVGFARENVEVFISVRSVLLLLLFLRFTSVRPQQAAAATVLLMQLVLEHFECFIN